MCGRIDYCNWILRSFGRSHITKQCACSTAGAIILPPFLRFRVDGRKRFEYATCGREFFQKRRKKPPFSKISAYVWTGPKSTHMALLKYFKKVSQDDVAVAVSESKLTDAEENAVKQHLVVNAAEPKKKKVKYGAYDACQRAEVAKWGIAHGIRPAARKYSIPESTVLGLIKSYKERKGGSELNELPRKQRGAKTLLPENIDEKVIAMIKSMRAASCIVNYNTAISLAKGIVLANDRSLLKENGGILEFHQTWCQSIFRRLGFSKRRATTAKQPVSRGFLKEIRFTFHRSIKEVVSAYDVPDDLIINIDLTPLPFVLISKYTMDKTNEK